MHRVPYHMQEMLVKYKSAKAKFQEEHNRPPTDDEMAAVLKVCSVLPASNCGTGLLVDPCCCEVCASCGHAWLWVHGPLPIPACLSPRKDTLIAAGPPHARAA